MPRQRGFTLIELLVVIAILSLLIVAFLPDMKSGQVAAQVTKTRGVLMTLRTAVDGFEKKNGMYPADEIPPKLALKPDNGINTSSEALVLQLAVNRTGFDLDSMRGDLGNTDKDDLGGAVSGVNLQGRMEVVDAWGTPILWFSKSGMNRPQRVQRSEDQGGDVIEAKAWMGENGAPLGSGKFQLVSAGPDSTFNTDDDITWPER